MHFTTIALILAFSVSAAPTPETDSNVSAVSDAPAKGATLKRRNNIDNCGANCQDRIATAKTNHETVCESYGVSTECFEAKGEYLRLMNIKNPSCNKTCQAGIRDAAEKAKVDCSNLWNWQELNDADKPLCKETRTAYLRAKNFHSGLTQEEIIWDSSQQKVEACEGELTDTLGCKWARDEKTFVGKRADEVNRIFSKFTRDNIILNVEQDLESLGTYDEETFSEWSLKFGERYTMTNKILSGKSEDFDQYDADVAEEVAAYEALGIPSTLSRRMITSSIITTRDPYIQASSPLVEELR
jgi:hypothetical protein